MVKKLGNALGKAYIFVILAILYAPIILIIVYSFSGSSNFNFDNGFTFEAYTAIFTSEKSPQLWQAIENTLIIAVISAVVSTVMGTFASIGIYSMGRRARRAVENVNQFPIINSEIVMAVSLMLFFATLRIENAYVRLILGHITFCTPYVVLSVMPRLMQMDPNIYEAALDLGASPVKAMIKVVVPYILPGVLSGFAMAFTISLDDFIITQLTKGASSGVDTLSTYLYSSLGRTASGMRPYWLPVFSIIIVAVVGIVLLINVRSYKKEGRKKEKNNEKSR